MEKQNKIDTSIGLQYQDIVCDKCKEKIIAATKKLGFGAVLRPREAAKRMQSVICSDCKKKIVQRMRERNVQPNNSNR